ncbi:GNAT family N-acetyltransferase [Streptomyces sp. NPDC086989]|uniref:GNAT family N-acetyltransferase n=1 Tax=Streptomyces sp. NPDC086989 TaxID=3365764 RepID=UPI00381B44B0
MPIDLLVARARGLWEDLARVPVSFAPPGGVNVVVSPKSGLCPPGWVGVVALGGSAVVTAPSDGAAAVVRDVLGELSLQALRDGARGSALIREAFAVSRMLGPATLSYASPAGFRPAGADAPAVQQLPAAHPDVRSLEQAAGQEDAGEAALDEITSPAFVVRAQGRVVSVAGYQMWPRRTAHISVLTALEVRGRGLARVTASAAVSHALAAGLLPQWRARPAASRRVAAALGFEELGFQLSFEIATSGAGALDGARHLLL